AAFVTLVRTKSPSPPAFLIIATVSAPSSLRSPTTTFARCRANASAVARPMPVLPPVMSTTFAAKSRSDAESADMEASHPPSFHPGEWLADLLLLGLDLRPIRELDFDLQASYRAFCGMQGRARLTQKLFLGH